MSSEFQPADLLGAPRRARGGLAFTWLLLFVACLPDAMLPPVLRQLVVDRFGASEPAAHGFMAVNLIGAILALPVLYGLRRLLPPATLIVLGAALNGVLLALLAWSPDLTTALVLRGLEGAADMTVLAMLLHVAARAGARGGRGRRLGASATVLMLGLAGGAVLGGVLGRVGRSAEAPGEVARAAAGEATPVLLVGAGLCLVLAVLAIVGAGVVNRTARAAAADGASSSDLDAATARPPALHPDSRGMPLWIPSLMMGTDRMLAGLLTTTVPLLLASRLGWSTDRIGGMLALPLLLMALGAYPAGLLADRTGALLTRTAAAILYAAAIAFLPVAGGYSTAVMLATLLVLGLAAAALMPTALALAAATNRGAAAMGTVQAAGNLGYLAGIAGAGWLLGQLGGSKPDAVAYAMVIQLFALVHVVATGVVLVEGRRWQPGDAGR